MILIFAHTHDNIQKGVKLETSLLAERRYQDSSPTGGRKEEMLDELIMDEEYEVMFRRLFNEAHAEVITRLPAHYLLHTPTDLQPLFREFPDFRQDRDFSLWLNMHDDFPLQYKKSIDIKIEQFFIDYICYRWLETKSPNDSVTYYSRLEGTIDAIKSLLLRKLKPLRRYPSFP